MISRESVPLLREPRTSRPASLQDRNCRGSNSKLADSPLVTIGARSSPTCRSAANAEVACERIMAARSRARGPRCQQPHPSRGHRKRTRPTARQVQRRVEQLQVDQSHSRTNDREVGFAFLESPSMTTVSALRFAFRRNGPDSGRTSKLPCSLQAPPRYSAVTNSLSRLEQG
jgi:hypothetical protein